MLIVVCCMQASVLCGADDARVASVIKRLVSGHKGQVSVVIRHIDSRRGFTWQAGRPMPTASLIKLAVLVEV